MVKAMGMKRHHDVQAPKKGGLTISRMFDAPRDLVWKAVTTPELVRRWWGPKGFTAPVIKIDLRVGGKYLYAMRSPEGRDYWSTGVFRKIIPPGGIILEDSFSDAEGNVVPASHYGMVGDWPLAMQVTMTFGEKEGRTKLTLLYNGTPPDEMIGNMTQGWNESLDKLAGVLEEEKSRRTKTALVAESENKSS